MGDMVCDIKQVNEAVSGRLKEWWQRWHSNEEGTPVQMHRYADWFKCRDHLDKKGHYLFDASMPRQLQRRLLQLRTFNLKLGVHQHKFGSRQSSSCQHCGGMEDEQHLLHHCQAYRELRTTHGIPVAVGPEVFTLSGPLTVAKYITACLKLPLHREDDVHVHTPNAQHESEESTDSEAGYLSDASASEDEVDSTTKQCRAVFYLVVFLLALVTITALTHLWAADAYPRV